MRPERRPTSPSSSFSPSSPTNSSSRTRRSVSQSQLEFFCLSQCCVSVVSVVKWWLILRPLQLPSWWSNTVPTKNYCSIKYLCTGTESAGPLLLFWIFLRSRAFCSRHRLRVSKSWSRISAPAVQYLCPFSSSFYSIPLTSFRLLLLASYLCRSGSSEDDDPDDEDFRL